MKQALSVKKDIAHYRIRRKLGAGGMGEVYLAEDRHLNRHIALKILPEAVAQDEDRVRRFIREAQAASALNHPNILTIYEVGESNGHHFIATELVAGETLRQRLKKEPLKLTDALEIAVQIAAALVAAHQAAIVHRDIKPENVMIRTDGIVKVLDFGLAKLVERTIENGPEAKTLVLEQATAVGTILGTTAYMSPEQVRGQRLDARSDIFSFGVVLYEMLAGINPFKGATPADDLAAVLQHEPQRLSIKNTSVPDELCDIVAKSLRKKRTERYRTSADLLRDLRQLQQQVLLVGASGLSRPSISRPADSANSLAILPLASDGGDRQTEYLADGITESIINALAQVGGLRLAPRNSVFRFKDRAADPQEAGRQLNVRTVLTGRVRHFGENLIIGVELIDVEGDEQIWGEQYRRQMADIFDVQEEIAKDISEKLKVKLTGAEKKRLTKRYTENAEAYQLYLKGRHFVSTKRVESWIKKGIACFQQAIELDPTYALAYCGLADAYAFLASSTGGWRPRDAYPKARAAAERALAIDETLGEAHASLGFYNLLFSWDFPESEKHFKRAIELSPNYPNAHDGYGFYLKAVGRHEDAIRECLAAQRLDPLSPFAHVSMGWAYYFARQHEHAVAECKKALDIDPNSIFAYRILGFAYLQLSRFKEALAALKKAVSLSGGRGFEAHIGYAYAASGKVAQARKVLSELKTLSKKQYVSSYYIAVVHLGLGEIDEAFESLEKAVEERSGFVPFLAVEPMLDAIRTDPRFRDLLSRVGLQE